MLQSLVVYGFSILIMFVLGHYRFQTTKVLDTKRNFLNWQVVAAVLFFAFLAGVRFDVGTDFLNYLSIYRETRVSGSYFGEAREWGHIWLVETLAGWGAHHAWMFGFYAFLQIAFLYSSFKDEEYVLGAFAVVMFCSGYYFTLMNELRQATTVSVFVYSIRLMNSRRYFRVLGLVLLASLLHSSAFLMIPLLVLVSLDLKMNLKRLNQMIILIAFMLVGDETILNWANQGVEIAVQLLGGESYYGDRSVRLSLWQRDHAKSVRYFGQFAMITMIIAFSERTKAYFDSVHYKKYYFLFFLGAVSSFLTYNNTLTQRPFRYLTVFIVILAAYTLYFLLRERRKWAIVFIGLHVAVFYSYVAADHHSYFRFFWEEVSTK